MIELWSWPTPNGQKVHIALEELGLPYTIRPVNISRGEQSQPAFLAVSPNGKIPAIVDPDGPGGPLALFESGAILIYLAEKAGRLIPTGAAERYTCLQWLMFQVGGIGPMFGQYNHFATYAAEKIPYAIARYETEVRRLYGVVDTQLAKTRHIAGNDYSIADIAAFTWLRNPDRRGVASGQFPAVDRWLGELEARPAVQRGLAILAPPTATLGTTHPPRVGVETARVHPGR